MQSLNNYPLGRTNNLNDYLVAYFNPGFTIFSTTLTQNSTFMIVSKNNLNYAAYTLSDSLGLAIVNITDKFGWASMAPFNLSNKIVAQ